MLPSKWLVFIRPFMAGFDRPLTAVEGKVMPNDVFAELGIYFTKKN
jgi:hypothetical protein